MKKSSIVIIISSIILILDFLYVMYYTKHIPQIQPLNIFSMYTNRHNKDKRL